MLDVSIEKIMNIVDKLLLTFKQIMAWLGVLVLPEEGEYDYPENSSDEL